MRNVEKVLWVALGIIVIVAVLYGFLPRVGSRGAAKRTICGNNLRMLSLALHNYQDNKGALPPLVREDDSGRALHSWRTAILPDMDNNNLFKEINFSEPWNSKHNSQFHDLMSDEFRCPTEKTNSNKTSYVAITGFEGSPWEGAGIQSSEHPVPMLVEMASPRWHWMQPGDLDVVELTKRDEIESLFGNHAHALNVAMSDGSIHAFGRDEFIDMLKKLATLGGDQ